MEEAIVGRRAIAELMHAYWRLEQPLPMKETGWEFIGAVDTNDLVLRTRPPVAHPRAAAQADAVERAPLGLPPLGTVLLPA